MYQDAIFDLELDQTVPSCTGEFLSALNSDFNPYDMSYFSSEPEKAKGENTELRRRNRDEKLVFLLVNAQTCALVAVAFVCH